MRHHEAESLMTRIRSP